MRICENPECENELAPHPGKGRPPKYCSPKCSKRAANLIAYAREKEATVKCATNGCGRGVYATALCRSHYAKAHRKPNRKVPRSCDACGKVSLKEARSARYKSSYCSTKCRDDGLRKVWPASSLPQDHWGRWYGATSQWKAPATRPRFFANTCDDCGSSFVEFAYGVPSSYCSNLCTKRVSRRRRRAREHDAPGIFTYAQVMRQLYKQGGRCAYCKQTCANPDAEHVTPLSRGGRNDMSNIVAACRSCNADKNDLSLDEWAADRARRNLPAVDTTLSDHAFMHLWVRQAAGEAWRYRRAA